MTRVSVLILSCPCFTSYLIGIFGCTWSLTAHDLEALRMAIVAMDFRVYHERVRLNRQQQVCVT